MSLDKTQTVDAPRTPADAIREEDEIVEAMAEALYHAQTPSRWQGEWKIASYSTQHRWRQKAKFALHALQRIAIITLKQKV